MVRLTGTVEIDGRRKSLDWTISETGKIVEGPGLSAGSIVATTDTLALTPSPTPEAPIVDEIAPVEPKSLEDMNKTELQVECNNRGLPATGTKAELLDRLNGANVEEAAVAEPSTEGDGDGESSSE